jgi:hypothetical protein
MVPPAIGAHLDRVAAFIIGAVDQDVEAGFPHLSEGDFLLAGEGGHSPMIPPIDHQGEPLDVGPEAAWAHYYDAKQKRRCYQRRSGAPTRGTGPLRLALAGATRSGPAGVGSRGSRSASEATPHPSGVNWNDN